MSEGVSGGSDEPSPPRPGIMALGELNVGGILIASARFVRANPVMVVTPALLGTLILLAVSVAAGWLSADADPAMVTSSGMSQELALVTLGVAALGVVVMPPLMAIVLSTLRPAVLGQPRVSLNQAWTAARPHLGAFYGVWLVVATVSVIPTAVELVISGPLHRDPEIAGSAGAIAGSLLLVTSYLVLVYLSVLIAFAPAAVVVEGKTTREALLRSMQLVRGAWWRCFGVLVVVSLVAAVAIVLVAAPAIGIAALIGLIAPGWLVVLVGGIVFASAFAISCGYTVGAAALLYQDQRIRRENYAADLLRDARSVS